MLSSKCQTQPYQVKCLVGVLEAQQHVLQDRQSPLPHDGVQQLREDLVKEKKKLMRRQDGTAISRRREQQETEALDIYHGCWSIPTPCWILKQAAFN